jgi:hypothetical protein
MMLEVPDSLFQFDQAEAEKFRSSAATALPESVGLCHLDNDIIDPRN